MVLQATEQIKRLKAELDKARTQRDAMFHEIETLRGKTGSCPQCEVLTAERDKLRAAGEALQESVRTFLNSYGVTEYHARQAMCDSALAWREAAGKERSDGE